MVGLPCRLPFVAATIAIRPTSPHAGVTRANNWRAAPRAMTCSGQWLHTTPMLLALSVGPLRFVFRRLRAERSRAGRERGQQPHEVEGPSRRRGRPATTPGGPQGMQEPRAARSCGRHGVLQTCSSSEPGARGAAAGQSTAARLDMQRGDPGPLSAWKQGPCLLVGLLSSWFDCAVAVALAAGLAGHGASRPAAADSW